jgi:oligopeptide transport system substrate-binding protein
MKRLITVLFVLCLTMGCSGPSSSKINKGQHVSVAIADDPASLDPRFVRDLTSSTTMRLLFEGLMRTGKDGRIVPGIAESVEISEDQKTYTFHLRTSMWGDGTPLTAEDFVQTWQSILSPSIPAPNAYQLYPIQGAKLAKEGKAPVDAIGVKALDPLTLVVSLEHPAPYFLEMVSCHFFFPVHSEMRALGDKMPQEEVIGNGPFQLDSWTKRDELKVAKNPHYWDASHIALEGISFQVLDEQTALQLFRAGQLDWAGSPCSTLPQDTIASLREQNLLHILPAGGTYWFRLNTKRLPFSNEKMRHAFSLSLDRQSLVEHVTQGNQQPAIGIIPPGFGLPPLDAYSGNRVAEASALFAEGLKEAGMTLDSFPQITLSYAYNDRNHKIAQAIQQQWSQSLGVQVALAGSEPQVHLDRVKRGEYWMSLGSWFADIRDPVNFLEIFKFQDNPTNQTFWQNSAYIALLDQADGEADSEKRAQLLAEAEQMLIQAMPVIPLFHSAYNYLKNEKLEGVYFSPLGYLDFKNGVVADE